LKNAEVEPSQIISKIQSSKGDVVYNAATHEFCNPFKAGIIDPAKVVLSSFEHATSSGLILLSVGATITDDNEELT
jgi:chaperonin GroEL